MRVLLDTNVLLRGVEPVHPQYSLARQAVINLLNRGDELLLVPQVLFQFWVVATRPLDQNGLGHDPATAAASIDRSLESAKLLEDPPGLFLRWKHLVTEKAVSGKPAHDARLVAAMNLHAIPAILTFNGSDFKRFDEISIVDPR